jgi:hypothetical protein
MLLVATGRAGSLGAVLVDVGVWVGGSSFVAPLLGLGREAMNAS